MSDPIIPNQPSPAPVGNISNNANPAPSDVENIGDEVQGSVTPAPVKHVPAQAIAATPLPSAEQAQLAVLEQNVNAHTALFPLKADLVNGKIPVSQLPDLGITEYKGAVADEAAMLALSAEKGDWVKRSDEEGQVYVLTGSDPSIASHWEKLVTDFNGFSDAIWTGSQNYHLTDADFGRVIRLANGLNHTVTEAFGNSSSGRVIIMAPPDGTVTFNFTMYRLGGDATGTYVLNAWEFMELIVEHGIIHPAYPVRELDAKANLSGAVFTGSVSVPANPTPSDGDILRKSDLDRLYQRNEELFMESDAGTTAKRMRFKLHRVLDGSSSAHSDTYVVSTFGRANGSGGTGDHYTGYIKFKLLWSTSGSALPEVQVWEEPVGHSYFNISVDPASTRDEPEVLIRLVTPNKKLTPADGNPYHAAQAWGLHRVVDSFLGHFRNIEEVSVTLENETAEAVASPRTLPVYTAARVSPITPTV
eukprot:Seg14146.3 transcript_id=Seg14146.3/GoldUCD/mRNA.D3Y31 product="hypothetical protein" protein_id=Seg14146.3/GoldUCD/D3Y31